MRVLSRVEQHQVSRKLDSKYALQNFQQIMTFLIETQIVTRINKIIYYL